MLNLAIYLNQTPIFGWCVVSCASKNRHQNDMCLKEIGLCVLNMLIIPDSIVNIIGGIYMTI